MTKRCIILKGLPASGKSTWAKQQVDANPGKYKIISKDSMRAMFDNGHHTKGNEKFVLKARDALILLALQEGYHPIIDDTNLHSKHIETITELVKGLAIVEIKDFTDVSLEECIARDKKRPNYVGEQVIRRMHRDFLETKPISPVYNPDLPKAVIVDLDGTLALFDREKVNPYERDFMADKINEAVRGVVWHYGDSVIFVLSGRKDTFREQTMTWLMDNGIPYYHLHMRKADDNRKDAIIKEEMYNEHIKGKYNVVAIIDDRLQVCRMWHKLGLPLFRVGDPDADF